MFELFDGDRFQIDLRLWAQDAITWIADEWRPFFQAVERPVEEVLDASQEFLLWMPDWAVIIIMTAIAYRLAGRGVAIFTVLAMFTVGSINLWDETMVSLAMVFTAVLICTIVGVPLGIAAARSRIAEVMLRPVLDAMQTTPSFVYLVPIVMLFGIGTVPGVMATIIFAMPPIIRLTNLGIREVDAEVVEAAYAFGATPRQILFDVQLPLAIRTVMAGLNQTLMLAMSMIVIASIIGAGGLGAPVRQGINNFQPGLAFVGGLAVVLLAMVLDRITQALGPVEEVRA